MNFFKTADPIYLRVDTQDYRMDKPLTARQVFELFAMYAGTTTDRLVIQRSIVSVPEDLQHFFYEAKL